MDNVLEQAVNGRVTLVVPGYNQIQTTLEYEESLKELRQPYVDLVRKGMLAFLSRHSGKEVYRLTARALETLAYESELKKG